MPQRKVATLIHDPAALRSARLLAGYNQTEAAAEISRRTGKPFARTFLVELEGGTRSLKHSPYLLRELAKLYRVPIRELQAKDAA